MLTNNRKPGRSLLGLILVGVFSLSGCNVLDVENPNNLVEEDLDNVSAAAAIVNGALSTVARGIGRMAVPYAAATDEIYWIGSRDAWQQLDFGIYSDPANEFTDGAYPSINEGRWMADLAIKKMEEFVAGGGGADLVTQRGRAYFVGGMVYASIADIFDDFTFSDKKEAAPPVGKANMVTVYDKAIEYLDKAQADATAGSELELRIIATRARAKHARAIWRKIVPSVAADPLVNDAGANADAGALVGKVGVTSDWAYDLTYSATTVRNDMGGWINQRSELQFGARYVKSPPDAPNDIQSIALMDPIDNVPHPFVKRQIQDVFDKAGDDPPLRIASAREAHLILAEAGLASSDMVSFTAHINHVRDLDGLTRYSGQVPALDMLKNSRMANLVIQNRRLADMYRFKITDDLWQPGSDALTRPGTFLPITIIEIRANPFLGG